MSCFCNIFPIGIAQYKGHGDEDKMKKAAGQCIGAGDQDMAKRCGFSAWDSATWFPSACASASTASESVWDLNGLSEASSSDSASAPAGG